MKKNTELLLAGIAVVVIVASLLYIFSYRQQEFAFSFEAENVLFASNVKNPGEQLRELSRRSSFLVVSDFLERGTASFMTQPITLFNSVLLAQEGKFVVTVAKTVDQQENIVLCDTNDGNKLSNRQVTAQECGLIIDKTPHVTIRIALPDSSLSKSRVIVFENSVLIEPNSFEEVARVSFLVAKTMFADSAEIIEIINGLVNVVKA